MRTTALRLVAAASLALAVTACGGGGFEEKKDSGGPTSAEGKAELRVLIGSSGDAETNAVNAAVDAWEEESGNTAVVTNSADLTTDLSKTFASNDPYDVMYIDAGRFATYADTGALYPYGDDYENVDDIYQTLRDTFTYDGDFYCAPKDFSTLALVINDTMWAEAGLTEADYPKTWDDLAAVAGKLTKGDRPGLVTAPSRDRLGAFMLEAGGWIVNEDATEAIADSAENAEALGYVQELLNAGSLAFFADVDAGWGGEAFGKQSTAMTIEGNWVKGAMSADFPDVDYTVVELPEGPAGQGTMLFSTCWGVAAKSDAQEQAIDLIESLTSPEQQLANADAFGVMPALESVREDYAAKYPEDAAFIAGAEYGTGPVSLPDFEPVLADFDSELAGLAKGDPQAILDALNKNASAALSG
ncbi:MAG: extracellular solute-binding protein [Propionibacteriales bacterium]|nr:extracellular solute-binding protein [Propionibacteriales bacterium]